MDEKYRQVTDIITNLATANPYITKEQVAKAKSMYNGDTRPIEIIQAELEAYSAQIEAQGKKREQDIEKIRDMQKDEGKTVEQQPVQVDKPTQPSTPDTPTEPSTLEEPEQIYEPLRTVLPNEKQRIELQNMINEALGEPTAENTREEGLQDDHIQKNSQAKVLRKTPEQGSNSGQENASTSNDGGYGNLTALLSLTIIFSIVAIIMAFFTIMAN